MPFKKLVLAVSMSAALFAGVSGANAQGYTTRIEPRPFYGAVVTLEEGVRVIRPLPPERHVIINPGNATPLSLGFNETRVYENRVIRNYHYSEGGSSSSDGGTASYGRAGYYAPSYVSGGGGHPGYVRGKAGGGHGHAHGHKSGHRGGHH